MQTDRHIRIFDTTLRDGQQCPGAGMSFEKNIEYALLARQLGVDVLEAGFPSASSLDFEIVNAIASELGQNIGGPVVAALCQLRLEQVEKTLEALAPAVAVGRARLHTYVPVDPSLLAASLGSRAEQKSEIVDDVHRFVSMAVKAGVEVQFSAEGYSRMGENFDFTTELIRAAVAAGAVVINCPDTIGGACSFEGHEYFVNKMNAHAGIISREFPDRQITWSAHCHNDLGLAVQNTLNAVWQGPARQIEGCINGIGERAGNASLEQCIVIIKHLAERSDKEEQPFFTKINAEMLQKISDFTSRYMLPRQPHWPVSGDNAAKHSSGGHTNAILKNPMAYQPFDPQSIGKQVSFVFGPLSGGNHAKSIIENSGYICADSEKAQVAQFVKERYHQRRKGITDDELMSAYFEFRAPIFIERIDYAKNGNISDLHFYGSVEGVAVSVHESHSGKDSALAALKKVVEKWYGSLEIQSHRSHSVSTGADAESVSQIRISYSNEEEFEGIGTDQDIEISAMRALIDAVNKAYIARHYKLNSGLGAEEACTARVLRHSFVA